MSCNQQGTANADVKIFHGQNVAVRGIRSIQKVFRIDEIINIVVCKKIKVLQVLVAFLIVCVSKRSSSRMPASADE